jgi:hypothetical protein
MKKAWDMSNALVEYHKNCLKNFQKPALIPECFCTPVVRSDYGTVVRSPSVCSCRSYVAATPPTPGRSQDSKSIADLTTRFDHGHNPAAGQHEEGTDCAVFGSPTIYAPETPSASRSPSPPPTIHVPETRSVSRSPSPWRGDSKDREPSVACKHFDPLKTRTYSGTPSRSPSPSRGDSKDREPSVPRAHCTLIDPLRTRTYYSDGDEPQSDPATNNLTPIKRQRRS